MSTVGNGLVTAVAKRTACIAVFTIAGILGGAWGRIPLYAFIRRLMPPGFESWKQVTMWLVEYHEQTVGVLLVTGTVIGLFTGIAFVRRSDFESVWLSTIGLGILCVLAVNLVAVDFKMLGAVLLPYVLLRHFRYLGGLATGRSVATVWSCFVALMLVPVDVSLANYPGPPHFIPVVCGGDLSFDGMRAANSGEFMIDGFMGECLSLPYRAWLLVW